MVGVSASVNLPLHHKVQKFSSGTGSLGSSQKRAVKRLWWWYTGQPALAGNSSYELANLVGAKFYCPHALTDGN